MPDSPGVAPAILPPVEFDVLDQGHSSALETSAAVMGFSSTYLNRPVCPMIRFAPAEVVHFSHRIMLDSFSCGFRTT